LTEIVTNEDGAIEIKSVWKKTPNRIHADEAIYPNRTSENTAELDDDHSTKGYPMSFSFQPISLGYSLRERAFFYGLMLRYFDGFYICPGI